MVTGSSKSYDLLFVSSLSYLPLPGEPGYKENNDHDDTAADAETSHQGDTNNKDSQDAKVSNDYDFDSMGDVF